MRFLSLGLRLLLLFLRSQQGLHGMGHLCSSHHVRACGDGRPERSRRCLVYVISSLEGGSVQMSTTDDDKGVFWLEGTLKLRVRG